MSNRLCREVLKLREPDSILGEVERRNLFVTRFGLGEAATYRYHNLFRDFLQHQLREEEPARYAALHLNAGAWYEQNDSTDEAVYHFLAAQAYREAGSLMERVAREWFWRGRVETLLGWAKTLPEPSRATAPWLLPTETGVDRPLDYTGAARRCPVPKGFSVRETACRNCAHQRAAVALFSGAGA
jgi:LuxR family maltose regulon positive regulatory protein